MGFKKVFIVNGIPRSGKDLFAELSAEYVEVCSYASINYIKDVARLCGWDGGKTERERKFLSDLKLLTSEYNDLSYYKMLEEIAKFNKSSFEGDAVLLINVREPAEIAELIKVVHAETIFIENPIVPMITSNMADANVKNYNYDHYIFNNGEDKGLFELEIKRFYKKDLNNNHLYA